MPSDIRVTAAVAKVLAAFLEDPTVDRYGLDLMRATDHPSGTLYPILTRLEADGLVTSSWREGDGGPGRKYFAITAAGRRALRSQIDDWHTFTGRVAALMATGRVET